jgi:hypothetical protein
MMVIGLMVSIKEKVLKSFLPDRLMKVIGLMACDMEKVL